MNALSSNKAWFTQSIHDVDTACSFTSRMPANASQEGLLQVSHGVDVE